METRGRRGRREVLTVKGETIKDRLRRIANYQHKEMDLCPNYEVLDWGSIQFGRDVCKGSTISNKYAKCKSKVDGEVSTPMLPWQE